ncbi:hypothetical protein HUN08_14745 [Gordonia sp. X0973]|uniref:hypothetical protein n=1 Tax=Gordonia sp. X0973 TaxID=2742602 RepID=UPI000F52C64D|nr:hypothetical protein [Gordonia sp. X0973]QKT08318.1 hypothetical protein HUN08_14745 [Gordonia sp. X0973]
MGAGLVAPPQAQAASNSYLGGTALDPEGLLQLVLGESAGSTAYQTLQSLNLLGDSNSTAVLPLSYAISMAGAGHSATAFSMLGLGLATTDLPLPTGVVGLPVRLAVAGILQAMGAPQSAVDSALDGNVQAAQVACLGGLTVAYSSTDGGCVNVLAVLNGDYNPNDKSISGAIVNPLAILSLLTDPGDVTSKLINGLLSGDSRAIQKLLTQDFVRLGFSAGGRTGAYGLPSLVSLTSDYGLKSPITAEWLGQKVTIFPAIASSATNVATPNTPNYFGFPLVDLNSLDTSQWLPEVHGLGFNNIRFPGENLLALGQLLGGLIGGSSGSSLPFSLTQTDPTTTLRVASTTLTPVEAPSVAPLAASTPSTNSFLDNTPKVDVGKSLGNTVKPPTSFQFTPQGTNPVAPQVGQAPAYTPPPAPAYKPPSFSPPQWTSPPSWGGGNQGAAVQTPPQGQGAAVQTPPQGALTGPNGGGSTGPSSTGSGAQNPGTSSGSHGFGFGGGGGGGFQPNFGQ